MADRLIPGRNGFASLALVFRVSILLICGATSCKVPAQTLLADPTRPPVGVYSPSLDTAVVTGPVLQSVMIPKKGTPVAVIGGQQVRLGEVYGESRLIQLTEREAVLESSSGVERLMLTPGVEKKIVEIHTKHGTPSARRVQSGSKK